MGFPQGKNCSRGTGGAWHPKKQKWAANHQTSPETGKNWQKKIPPIPTMANDSFLEGNERNMEEMGNVRKVGKISRREPGWAPFCGLSRGKIWDNYSRGIGDAWHPSKTKVGSCYNHKTNPEIGKKNKTSDNQTIFLFPLIPVKATTTKLAQKLEKHPKPIKTMFNQGVAERAFV